MTVPYYISENDSDMRGIKHGWYAIEDDGNLSSGPFPSFEECVTRIGQAKRCPMNSSANAGSWWITRVMSAFAIRTITHSGNRKWLAPRSLSTEMLWDRTGAFFRGS
jgi:hypothetical protein